MQVLYQSEHLINFLTFVMSLAVCNIRVIGGMKRRPCPQTIGAKEVSGLKGVNPWDEHMTGNYQVQ